ncbi:MAG: AraC family transcriptional regulator [Candidatus Dormibacteraeota bacterium]|nr:AraC family transcriptional regulator [Candidatus Dormibacteraeota bacterium]MBV9524383.1 AraC family transcriptional regulator [Candidatus Dormibacteraeota bacterium]
MAKNPGVAAHVWCAAQAYDPGDVKALGTFPAADGMSQMLLRMSVTSTVYCLSDMSEPWGFRVGTRDAPAFHLLTSGGAWLEVEGQEGGIRLHAGDLIVLPHGDGHQLRDSPTSRILWLDDILAATPPVNGRLKHGGDGERAQLVCGGFAIDQVPARPLLETLPRVIHLRGNEGSAPEWLAGLIRMISVEMASSGPGAEAVVTRLSDALLAQALRAHLLGTEQPSTSPLRDPQVARALRLMRERPEESWSVPALAAAVGLSRSAFAQRFRSATGETPMRSLTRYRLSRAAEYLRTSEAGVREIALRTGYDSEVSISKAFRRQYGTSPGAYRKASAN